MKKIVGMVAGFGVLAAVAMAGSPAQITGTVAAAGTSLDVPASVGTGFKLQAVQFSAANATVHTVKVVVASGAITNYLGVKTVSATALYGRMLVVTNSPWLFAGDKVRLSAVGSQIPRYMFCQDCG